MHCKILLHVFLCMCLLFMLADAWWSRSGSRSSSSRSSRSNTRSSTTRRTTTTRKPSTNRGWFWGKRTPRKVTSAPTKPPVTIKPTTKKRTWWRRKPPKPLIPTIPTPVTTTKKDKIFEKAEEYNKLEEGRHLERNVRLQGKSQILANDWADPNSENVTKTGYYTKVLYKDRQKGDIIAFKRDEGQSGHLGIVSSKDNFISALKNNLGELNIENFRDNPKDKITGTTVWRYIGPLNG